MRTHLGLGSLVQRMAAKSNRTLGSRHLQHPCNSKRKEVTYTQCVTRLKTNNVGLDSMDLRC